jgi:hypothetical protein
MNHSIYSADRATHLKIVVLALLMATAVSALSLFVHSTANAAPAKPTLLVLAGNSVAVSRSIIALVR